MENTEQELASFIETILGNDNNLRRENEAQMNLMILAKPNDFILYLLNLLSNYRNPSVRSFCAIALRKYLSFYSEKNYQKVWELLTPKIKEKVKKTLFATLETEPDMGIRHKVCDAIGEIASGLINCEEGKPNEWPELVPLIMELLMSDKLVLMESGLKILSTLFIYAESVFLGYKEELGRIFKAGIENDNRIIQNTTIEALSNFLSNVGSNHVKPFENLIPGLLEASYSLLKNDPKLGENALKNIEQIAESEPRYFRKNFPLLFEAMKRIFFDPEIPEMGHKKIATETLLSLAERVPKFFRDHKDFVKELLQILFYHMIDIEETVSLAWQSPEEGFNADLENDSDYEAVLFGTVAIDKLIASIGEKDVLPILSVMVQAMMERNDWRCKHAGIMALSQVGEYLDRNIEEIAPIINLVLSYLEDSNPKIRYASCHCIGQIANDMRPLFQNNFHETILPALIAALRDPIPRVHAHAAAAITNFVEGMSPVILKPYLTNLLTQFYEMIQKGISIVKENAISAVAATAEAAQDEFRFYYKDFIGLLFKTLETHNSTEYRTLNGIVIECLTLIVHAIGREHCESFIIQLIKLLMSLQESISESSDPLKIYVIWGWQRLFLVLKAYLFEYLVEILPPLLKLLTLILTQPIEEDKEEEVSPEISASVNLIATLVEEIGEQLGDYVLNIIQLILPMATNAMLEAEIRKMAAKTLPKILETLRKTNQSECRKYGSYFVNVLLQSLSEELDPNIIRELITVVKDCIWVLGLYLTEFEISEISKRIVKVIYDSDQRKDQEKNNNFEEADSDELEQMRERINNEEDLQISVAQLIGILFKTHNTLCLKFAEFLYSEVVSKVLQPGLSDKIHKLGLVLIDDMMEYLGRELLKEKWTKMAEFLGLFIFDPACFVREAANYGVGVFASQAKEEFLAFSELFIEKMSLALDIQQQREEKQRVFMHCRDNIVAALGKIIYYQSDRIDVMRVLRMWVRNLPIRFERFECYFQHEFLGLLALNKRELVFQDEAVLAQVITVFAEIVDSKLCNQKIKNIITLCLRTWLQEEQNVVCINIVQKMTLFQQKKIKDCLVMGNAENNTFS